MKLKKRWTLARTTQEVLPSVGKVMGVCIHNAQVQLEGNYRVSYLYIYEIHDVDLI